MLIEYDPNKNESNIQKHGLSFLEAQDFLFGTALVQEDTRKEYPERRYIAVGYIGVRLHVLCFTPIPYGIRVISLRKGNDRELLAYLQASSD